MIEDEENEENDAKYRVLLSLKLRKPEVRY